MKRRNFLKISGAAPFALKAHETAPEYKVVTAYKKSAKPGMPGPYPGTVVSVHSEKCIDAATEAVDRPTIDKMMSQGMRQLTGAKTDLDAWKKFISPSDIVGLKANCSGAPGAMSLPEIIGEIVRNVIAVGVKPENIYVYERSQLQNAPYSKFVPQGVNLWVPTGGGGGRGGRGKGGAPTPGAAAGVTPTGGGNSATSGSGYDPKTYVECNFFGEENTRSEMLSLVSEKLTKIINVPQMKDHGAAGVTGCLKNIAYGHFSNVGRSHREEKTHTLTFIGTLAATEPNPSKVVLNIMDGVRGVWHAGPFSRTKKFRFYPKTIFFGTDPIAMDHLLLDLIDAKRKKEGAISVGHHDKKYTTRERLTGEAAPYADDPNVDRFVREPGHIEYAGKTFGLGVYDLKKIKVKKIEV